MSSQLPVLGASVPDARQRDATAVAPPSPPAVPLDRRGCDAPAEGQAKRQPHRLRHTHRARSLHYVSGGAVCNGVSALWMQLQCSALSCSSPPKR